MTTRQGQAALRHLRDLEGIAESLPKGQANKAKNKIYKVKVLINKQLKTNQL